MAIQEFGDLVNDFTAGFQTKRNPSDLPLGAAQSGQNIILSDGDKIKPIEGWELFGAPDSSGKAVISATTFALSTGLEIPIRTSGTVVEYYNEGTGAFEVLASGYTDSQRFGFAQFFDSDTFQDELYFCNGTEPYTQWKGAYSQLDGALVGGETEVVVDSVLQERVHFSGTADSSTTTTIDIASSEWATSQWDIIFYVRITSGAQTGKISVISATTPSQITFTAIAGLSGTPTFEIRQAMFADSGLMSVGGVTFTYASLDQDNRFAGCTGVTAALDNAGINQAVTPFPGNPTGNILETLDERMYIAHDKEAALFISAVNDATDFTFGSPRAAGEGDFGVIPEGGGPITGMGVLEKDLVVLKRNTLKGINFSKDKEDLIQLATLIEANGVGTISPKSVFRVDNQLYYASPDGGVKDVGRVPEVNFVQALQIADPIRTTVNEAVFDEGAAGFFFDSKAYISAKKDKESTANDIIFVFNFLKRSWELPIIGLAASDFFIYKDDLYATSSRNNECFKMNTGNFVIKKGEEAFPYRCTWTSGLINFGLPANRKAFNMLYVEGFIARNTDITVRIDYEKDGVYRQLSGIIEGDDDQILIDAPSTAPLGVNPLALGVLGAGQDTQETLNKFRVYLTLGEIPFYEASVTFETDGEDQQWEINRFGFNAVPINQIDPKIKKALK